jgi:hypothetical protein
MVMVFWPNSDELVARGFAEVAHVPVLFSQDWRYLREPNRYLRERALLEWHPTLAHCNGSIFMFGNARFHTHRTLEEIARRLANFLEWSIWRKLALKDVLYRQHIVEGYAEDMAKGRWADRGRLLGGSSIEPRVSEACSYVQWAAANELRGPFAALKAKTSRAFSSSTAASGERPIHPHTRERPASLRMPTDEEVHIWLRSVQIRMGLTKTLACELVIESAIRLMEAAEWRENTLPLDERDWNVRGSGVIVTVKYGAKGQKTSDEFGDLHGPPRDIVIPLEFAKKIHVYRNTRRLASRDIRLRAEGKSARSDRGRLTKPERLFLSEYDGCPLSDETIYQAWKSGVLPYDGWSPQLGRHFWACRTLLRIAELRARQRNARISEVPSDWLLNEGSNDIDLLIRPQLGHVDKSTTESYLVWLQRAVTLTSIYSGYHDYLEGQ